MKKVIGVMGPGEKSATATDLAIAYEVGKGIAQLGAVLLSGAMTGVMEESARGAKESGGLTIGLAPGVDKSAVNSFIDVAVMTGMHSGRNFVNITSSDFLVFITVNSAGTLSELAFAIQLEKPSVVIGAPASLQQYINDLDATAIHFVNTAKEAMEMLNDMI